MIEVLGGKFYNFVVFSKSILNKFRKLFIETWVYDFIRNKVLGRINIFNYFW